MEPLPSEVARLVLGYLLDSCPAVADQFLAASPDLAEVRRLRPRALRPFGLSLVELLTEHATAFSLVDDLYAAIERPGTRTCGGDFLSKLRRLLSLIAETKGVAVSAADVHSPGVSSGGPRHGPEADTAGRWSVGDHSTDSHDEPPAIGGDWADTPTREAAAPAEDDPHSPWDATYGSADHQSSPCGSPNASPGSPGEAGEADDCKPGEDLSMDSKPAGETATQTALTDFPVVKTEVKTHCPESETTDGPRRTTVDGDRRSSTSPVGDNGTTSAPQEAAGMKSRRKIRPPRRACPERLTALVGNRPSSQPAGWIYGQVRHLLPAGRSQVARTAETPSGGQSTHRPQQTSERLEPELAASHNQRVTHPAESDTPSSPSPPPSNEATSPHSSASVRTGRSTVCAATAAPTSTVLPCAAAVRSRMKRKGSPPRRRRPGQCGATAGVLPRHKRSRSPYVPVPRLVEGAGRVAVADGDGESAAEADTVLEPMDDASDATGDGDSAAEADTDLEPMDDASDMTESSDGDEPESLVMADDPPQSPVATSQPTAAPPSVPNPAGVQPNSHPESGSISRPQSFARNGGDPCRTTDAVRESPPSASSARCNSPPQPPAGSAHVPSPSPGPRVPSPSPGQLSGRSSLPSGGRSTPASQRSLRICLSPVSWGTPSANGSFREGETPTSARQTSARPDRSGGSSSRRRAVAPRRRLLNDLRRGLQSCGEMPPPEGLSRPAAQSTPSVSGRVCDAGACAGAGGSDDSPVAGGPRRTPSHAHGTAAKRPAPTGDGSLSSPPVKVPSRNTRDLLKSVDIMSFLSRIHSPGSK